MTIGWGIIGAGKLAELSIAPAIAKDAGSSLVAVCSRDQDRARAFADRHGASGAYDDYAKFLADEQLDVVFIATPNGMHREQTIAAVEAGKHVLVEKPMALSMADGRAMRDAADAADRLLGVGFHLRHKSTNREARRLIAEGRIGRVFNADVCVGAGKGVYVYDTWRADPSLAGGGTLLNQGTHAIDLLEFLTGQHVVEVTAALDHELEDAFVGTCRLDGGALASVSSHQLHAGTRPDWVVMGEAGWLTGRGGTSPMPGDQLVVGDGPRTELVSETADLNAYDLEVATFAAAVRGNGSFDATGSDGLRNIAVCEAFYRSARDGRASAVEAVD